MEGLVVNYDGEESDFVNAERAKKMVRITAKERKGLYLSYGEVLNGLSEAGIKPEEIQAVFKVGDFKNAFNLLCTYDDTVQKLLEMQRFKVGDDMMIISHMSRVFVTVKVHWLPIQYDNSLLKEIFGAYGKVLNVRMLKSFHEKFEIYSGIREVILEVDEKRKQEIPHLIQFKSGHSILVTMAGRLPFCLRCRCTGHIRSECPKMKRNVRPAETLAAVSPQTPAPGALSGQSSEASASAGMTATPNKETGVPKEVASGREQPSTQSNQSKQGVSGEVSSQSSQPKKDVINGEKFSSSLPNWQRDKPKHDNMDVEFERAPKRGRDPVESSPRLSVGKTVKAGPTSLQGKSQPDSFVEHW